MASNADDYNDLLVRVSTLEFAVRQLLKLAAEDPATLERFQRLRDGYLFKIASFDRPSDDFLPQEEIAQALHRAVIQLFEFVPWGNQ